MSSTLSTKRRSSARASPGAPRQRWYCSVCFWWKRTVGLPLPFAGVGRLASPEPALQASATSSIRWSCSTRPAAATTTFGPRVAAVVVGRDVRHRHTRDHLSGADDRPPKRVIAEHGRRQDVVHLVGWLVLVHGDLLDHHLALGVDVRVGGPQHHVRHHVERAVEVLIEEARVDRGGLLARPGVDLRPEPVEDLVDLGRAEARRALEQQMLEEVRDPGLPGRLVTRADLHPEPEGDGSHRGHRLGDDPYTRVELGERVFAAGAQRRSLR